MRADAAKLEALVKTEKATHSAISVSHTDLRSAATTEKPSKYKARFEVARLGKVVTQREREVRTAEDKLATVKAEVGALRSRVEQDKIETTADEARLEAERQKRESDDRSRAAEEAGRRRMDEAKSSRDDAKDAHAALEERIRAFSCQTGQTQRTREDSFDTNFSRSTAPTSVHGPETLFDGRAAIQQLAATVNALNRMSDDLYTSVAALRNKNGEPDPLSCFALYRRS